MRLWKRQTPSLEQAISVLTIAPGDRIVVACADRLTREQGFLVRQHVAEFAGIDPERVLVVMNATVSVLRHGDPPPPPVYIPPEKEARGI